MKLEYKLSDSNSKIRDLERELSYFNKELDSWKRKIDTHES